MLHSDIGVDLREIDKIHSTLRTQTADFVHGFDKFRLKRGLSEQVNERHTNTLLYSLVYSTVPYTVVPIILLCNILASTFLFLM